MTSIITIQTLNEINLSQRVRVIKPSATLAVTARANELRAAGHDVIGLGAGEPDFDTPEHIKQAAIAAIQDGDTKYTAVDGTPALKEAVRDKLARENGLQYEIQEILVSAGAKHCLYNLFQAILNKNDEVIIPAPYWVSYPDMVLLSEAVPEVISTTIGDGFKVSPDQLANAITDATRVLVLNSPSNPTGSAYHRDELEALAGVLLDNPHVLVVTDDIYEHILWSGEPFGNIVNACPELKGRAIVVNGVSKAYAMTGWRIGYAAGPAQIIGAMKKIQSQSTSNPTSISQAAAVAALSGDQACIEPMVKEFQLRHDYVVERLQRIEGVNVMPSLGTFYSFPDFTDAINRLDGISDDIALATFLLEEGGVALVPGSAFGAPGHMRLSYATSMGKLEQALNRLEKVFQAR